MTDNNGNLRKQDVVIPGYTTRRQEYDYDPLNRLNWARELLSGVEQWKQQFTYDRWGNRTINTGVSYGGVNEKDFTVNTANNRLGVPGGQAGVMDYDNAGNLISDTYIGAGNRTYDAENRIVSAWGGNNQAQLYGYDAVGKRIKRMVNGTETWQVYGLGGELIAEYPANGVATSPQKEYGYRNGQLLITAEPVTDLPINVALASNGATATASSTFSGFAASGAINGDRKGLFGWQDGYWSTASAGFPAWLEVQFNGSKTITEIDVVTLQDNYNAPIEPTESTSFTLGGLAAYQVQYWNGSAWATIPNGSVSDNNKVWKKFSFAAITTTKIRVLSSASPDNYSRLTEVEAWTGPSPAPRYNLALGATATASSNWTGWPPSSCVNGDRKSLNAGTDGGWVDAAPANTFPDWLQVDFGATKTINEVDVFTLQDNYAGSSEPTESMTFTQWGLTAYTVEYWSGSGWILIPGASVTGNNKIWRKFEFSPISTSKIRVVTSASVDGYSRLTEVEAYGPADPGGSGNGIHWLVTDHLGTPRMTFDQTGDLANLTRHDYLPFGEELFAPTGGRSAAQGYGGADRVRQQFTAQERDLETNLDYFNARYYSSMQGRFTSPDPYGGSGFVSVPQSWNKYAYVLNRPFVFTDPSGEIWLTKDDKTYIWVEDAEYEKNKDLYKGYSVANGAIIQFRGSGNCERCEGIALGKYVRLDESGDVQEVADPTMDIYAAYDELTTMVPAITGSIRHDVKGPPGRMREFRYGNSRTERWYDENGRPWVDIDYGHDHNGAGDPHVHWWDWNNPTDPRGPAEAPPAGWPRIMWDNGEPTINPKGKIQNPTPGTIPILPADMPMTMPVRPGVPVRPMVPLRPILVP